MHQSTWVWRSCGGVAAALFLLSAGEAAARPAAPKCQSLVQDKLKGILPADAKAQVQGDACVFRTVTIKMGAHQGWSIDALSIAGLADWDGKALPPQARIEAKGIRFAPQIDSAHYRYQLSLTQRPFDARLAIAFDAATMQLQVREITIESPAIGRVSLGFDTRLGEHPLGKPGDLLGTQVSRVHLSLDNITLFESMLMPMIIGLVPQDKDPAVEFPRMQQQAIRDLRALPEAVMDSESRDALIRFTRDFPHPRGHFEFDLALAQPWIMDGARAGKPDKDWLKGAKIQARYVPTEPGRPGATD